MQRLSDRLLNWASILDDETRRQAERTGPAGPYSRTKARKTFTRAQLDASMQGIEWRHSDVFLDEIPAAYKPIDRVMADSADLVEIRHTLRQLVNVKGD